MNTPGKGRKSRSVLVVDDDPISREVVALILASQGHCVTKVASGEEALSALADASSGGRPTAILVDLNMPGLSGEELAERLRIQAGSGVRVLAMSATNRSQTASFDGFLLKPVDPELLARMLAAVDPQAPGNASARSAVAGEAIGGKASPGADADALNPIVFARLQAMMPKASVDEIFDACLEDARKRIPQMAAWLATGDFEAVRRAAHTLKGGSSMIGAVRLSEIARKIETGNYKPDEGRQFLKELSTACDELQGILLERNS